MRYPCDQCEYAATQLSALNTHKQSIHEGVRYICDLCDYAATTLSVLKRHKDIIHEGVRYPCDQCEYAGTYKSALNKHKSMKHAGVDECGVTAKKTKLTAENIEPKPEPVKYEPEFVHVKNDPDPEYIDHDISIKAEDPLVGY